MTDQFWAELGAAFLAPRTAQQSYGPRAACTIKERAGPIPPKPLPRFEPESH